MLDRKELARILEQVEKENSLSGAILVSQDGEMLYAADRRASLMRGQEDLQDEQAGHADGDGQQGVLCAPGDEDGE